jgi:hypothetical protein
MSQTRIAALVTLGLLAGCWDYSVRLPNGFRLVRLNGAERVIVLPDNRVLIDPDVRKYAVVNEVVVGFAEIPEPLPQFPKEPPPARQKAGYFIVDTKSAKVWDGTSKEAWLAQLRVLGIEREPHLKRPSPFD